MKSWEEATEEEKRILRRAQEEAENLIDVRVKIGELYSAIPKESGKRTDVKPNRTIADRLSEKQQFKQQTGLSNDQAERYAKLASHPEAVEAAKVDARENNDVVSQQKVMRIITANTPSPPKAPSLGQQAREAKKRRQEFEEKRQEGVISMDDARNDLEDKKIISREIYAELQRITVKTHWLAALNKSKDFQDMLDVITQDQKERMTEYLETIIPILGYVLDLMKGVKS